MTEDHPGQGIVGEQLEKLLAQMQHQPFDGERAFAFDRVDSQHVSAVVAVPPQAGLSARFLWISVDGDTGPFSKTDTGPNGEPTPVLYGFPFQNLDDALSQHNETVTTWLIHKTLSLRLDWFVPASPHHRDGDAPAGDQPDFLTARRVGDTFYVAGSFAGTISLHKFSNPDIAKGYLGAVTALVAAGRRQLSTASPDEEWEARITRTSLKNFVAEAATLISRCQLGNAIREGFEQDRLCRHETFSPIALAAHLGISETDLQEIRARQKWSPIAEMINTSEQHGRDQARE